MEEEPQSDHLEGGFNAENHQEVDFCLLLKVCGSGNESKGWESIKSGKI